MSKLTEAVGAVSRLHSITQEMHAVFLNDRSQDRAEEIDALAARADRIARTLLDSYPPNFGANS